MNIVLWGGTIEGRKISEYLCGTNANVSVCVATGYGKDLLPEAKNLHVFAGRLDAEEMAEFLEKEKPDLGIDATHPYAVNVSENIRRACAEKGVPYLRVKRNETDLKASEGENITIVTDTEEAVRFLCETAGKIFLTTGSKELEMFTKIPDFQDRVIARVLSSAEVVQKCKDLGFPGRHIIAAQGPFGEEINYAMLKEYEAAWMVTKNTGDAGGFQAKWDAALRAGVGIVVIGRPQEEAEICVALEQVPDYLKENYGIAKAGGIQNAPELKENPSSEICRNDGAAGTVREVNKGKDAGTAREDNKGKDAVKKENGKRTVFLVGIGPGEKLLMTGEAVKAMEESDVLIGAQRMLDAFPSSKPFYKAYLKEDIKRYIEEHPEFKKIAVLLSGDIGFYSGAKGLKDVLSKNDNLILKFIPGISSPVYFMDRLGLSWDDCLFTSIHGQKVNILELIRTNRKVCTLLGSKTDVSEICEKLIRMKMPDVRVTVGSRFSYPDEAIVSGNAESFIGKEITSLSVALFENDEPVSKTGGFGVPDEEFIRGKVPMTKEEVRAVSLAKLRLLKDSVVYDVGAGTGSVTMEIAGYCTEGKVYAIETNEEALDLIRQNSEKFCVDNVEIISGMAPECMKDLPAPTHVFLGGTKGNLKGIVELVRSKNPEARFVMNVITPESLAQALEFGGEIVQLQVSRGRKAGNYHLMTAENPVYIITF